MRPPSPALWKCKSCRKLNLDGATRCTICRREREGGEEVGPAGHEPKDHILLAEREEEARHSHEMLLHLGERLKEAAGKLGDAKESMPPRAAIRIVVPNDWMGWLTAGAVILGLAVAVAVIKSMF